MSPRQRLQDIAGKTKAFGASLDTETYATFRSLLSDIADACERLPPDMIRTALMLLIDINPPSE
jgi:hypothetical protein